MAARNPRIDLEIKYTAAGWTIFRRPARGINDYVAHKGERMHFIQLLAPDDPRKTGGARGNFVQNAFSNAATPVYAEVGPRGVTLTDANTGARIIAGKTAGAVAAPAVKVPAPAAKVTPRPAPPRPAAQ